MSSTPGELDTPDPSDTSSIDFFPNHNSRPLQLVHKELGRSSTTSSTTSAGKLKANKKSTKDEEAGAAVADASNIDTEIPRLVQRDRAFYQSSNKLKIQHNQGTKIFRLLRHNWFHAFLRLPTVRSFGLLLSFWTLAILLFALFYIWYDHSDSNVDCRLGEDADTPMTFGAAFAFSLETCTTVGYGLPHGINSYFNKCQGLQLIIYFQMAWSMIFNAFLITFLYNRLGRSETRGTQVIFSKNALVSVVDGQVRFQLRLFDVDARRPVVEAHVRMYVVMKERPVPRPLRLLQPDDDMGGMLFLSFPTVVSHHIDLYSLLHPTTSYMSIRPSGLVLRQVDGWTANRDDIICPVCGESYGTIDRLRNHVRYTKIVEAKDDFPKQNTHLSLNIDDFQKTQQPTTDLEELKAHFSNNVSEVIAVVEGIDPMMSGTFQSLHSFRVEDIVWDAQAQFAPCMEIVSSTHGRFFQVDLERYHDISISPDPPAGKKRRQKQVSNRVGDSFFSTNTMTVRKARQEKRSNSSPPPSTVSGDEGNNRANINNKNGAATAQLATLFQPPPPRPSTPVDSRN